MLAPLLARNAAGGGAQCGQANSLEVYDGDHTNMLGFGMQDHVLPFFGANLSFDPAD
ncbi:hypothetical protein M3P36_10735 [Altererythrobacter sp. KTW20L]|uniref:hypothetical protein n=1 Tax=Altererythrobacter sp. KTW20L TaxID=2942210 RepID=UPI0020BD4BF7|nr:hypothetical protein [Altererythrobacter sp. KTW20L]MCL6251514.1 hypothetical protein [Altererythrobacter sp. KTW20L]